MAGDIKLKIVDRKLGLGAKLQPGETVLFNRGEKEAFRNISRKGRRKPRSR
jgi:hypothetical protein